MNETVKVSIIGTSDSFLNSVRRALSRDEGLALDVRGGALSALAEVGDGSPHIALVQALCREPADFEALAQFTRRNPTTTVVLVCPHKDADMMVQSLRAGVKEFLFEPVQETEISAVVSRLAALHASGRKTSGKSEVMAFLPCKGGSGATFLAANLAHVLAAEKHLRVLLLDLNLQFGDAYLFLMDRMPPSTLTEICTGFNRLDAAFLESACAKLPSGLHLLPAPKSPVDAEIVKPEHIEGIVALARTRYDFVVLDVGRMIDNVALKALDLADHVYPVLQLTLPYLRDANRMKELFQKLGYSENKVRWVVNRYGAKEELTLADAQHVLTEAFWTVPNDHQHVSLSVNQGLPITQLAPHSPCAKSLLEWAEKLAPVETKHDTGFLGRWFGH